MTWTGIPGSGPVGLDGGITFLTDNLYNIGAPGANRPAAGYFGTELHISNFLAGSNLSVVSTNATNIVALIYGTTSQTGDLLTLRNSGNVNIFQFTSTALMINGIQFNPANAGGGPSIVTIGSDAAIALTIQTKGAAGGLSLLAGSASNMQFSAGAYQFMISNPVFLRDANNNTLLALQQLASSVGYIQITPTLAGGQLLIAAVSSDPTAGIDIDTKGGGQLRLNRNSGSDIVWGRPLVALGGGVAPTLGTIGGSGPATAAQNSWMRVTDSTGAAFWVPAWK